MMRRILGGGLAVAALVACHSEVTQQSLLQRHIDARGGRAALENLKVVERSGTIKLHGVGPMAQGSYRTCQAFPDRVIVDIDAGPLQVHQVLADGGAYECDKAYAHCAPAPADLAEELRNTARYANREELRDSIAPDTAMELILDGSTPIGYQYIKQGRTVALEFAPDSGLQRGIRNGSRGRLYGNWKDVGGVLFPMQIIESVDDRQTATVTLSEISRPDQPGEWCAQHFAMPAAGGSPATPAQTVPASQPD